VYAAFQEAYKWKFGDLISYVKTIFVDARKHH